MIPIEHFLAVSAVLFCVGAATVVVRRNAILVLMGIELMLNAANLNLVAFSYFDPRLQGQAFALFVIVVAAAEAAVALAIVIKVYRHYQTANLDELDKLKG